MYRTVWIASNVSLRQSSSHKIVPDRRGLRPIARIEHGRSKRSRSPQSPQALTIVCVMFSYNRPNRKTTFLSDSGDRNDGDDYMRTNLNQCRPTNYGLIDRAPESNA